MSKTYNTPKRPHILKTHLDDEEHAEFTMKAILDECSCPVEKQQRKHKDGHPTVIP